MNESIQSYIKHRESFLRDVVEKLSTDERFVAAWLTGSFARGEEDTLSDIDITLVVANEYCQTLCARHDMLSAQTSQGRYNLFCSFGQPALIHENNNNAPEGGTFTFIAYDPSAVMVDWVLRPFTGAQRPEGAKLLFERVNIPIQSTAEPESQQKRAQQASERMAFFWMMAAITVKYIYRQVDVFVNTWLEVLAGLVSEVERRIQGQVWQYKRSSRNKLAIAPAEQIAAIRRLCKQMESLQQHVADLGGYVSESPMTVIEPLIRVAQEKVETNKMI
ncbi:MAG TPA: nucleotidyltransferase domain-containing protein [Anaerolineales bacterium]|nr:nucleotidyltransferase domain-containing protein [Anaerolineales bacterium]